MAKRTNLIRTAGHQGAVTDFSRMSAFPWIVIAGLDPAIHLLRKKCFANKNGPPKSGLPDFGHF
jgi:hypothetical protein